jgi:hypothetical protein
MHALRREIVIVDGGEGDNCLIPDNIALPGDVSLALARSLSIQRVIHFKGAGVSPSIHHH